MRQRTVSFCLLSILHRSALTLRLYITVAVIIKKKHLRWTTDAGTCSQSDRQRTSPPSTPPLCWHAGVILSRRKHRRLKVNVDLPLHHCVEVALFPLESPRCSCRNLWLSKSVFLALETPPTCSRAACTVTSRQAPKGLPHTLPALLLQLSEESLPDMQPWLKLSNQLDQCFGLIITD